MLSFEAVVDSLQILKYAGKLDEGDMDKIRILTNTANELIDLRLQAILDEKPPPEVTDDLSVILHQLIKYELKGQTDGQ